MNDLRAWIVALALTAFGVGVATGLLLAEKRNPRSSEPVPFSNYQQLLTSSFSLPPPRRQALSQVMGLYEREVEIVRQRYLAKAGSDMERDLVDIGLRYRDLIRNHVLPPAQRERFDRLTEGTPVP